MIFLNKYNAELINYRIKHNRITYDVKIENTIITDYSPSPMITDEDEMTTDAMRFVIAVASEWLEDQRDDGDGFFEDIYNQLHDVISDDDIMELYYELESNEN